MRRYSEKTINSWIIVIYIYATSISLLFAMFTSTFLLKNIIILFLIVLSLFINNFKFNKYFLYYLIALMIFLFSNAVLVDNPTYPLGDGLNLLFYSFIPFYIVSINGIVTKKIISYWLKAAIFFSLLMPIYYYLRITYVITYYEIGLIAYYNFFGLITYAFINKNNKLWIFILINLSVIGILGSRMTFLASILTLFIAYLVFSPKKNFIYYAKIILTFLLAGIIYLNLLNILNSINLFLLNRGISSRNLTLFIQQINGSASSDSILSGRQEIYPVVLSYIKERGFFPSGFGMARFLTEGKYYHSHNFLTELILIFGIFGLIILLTLTVVRIFEIKKNKYGYTESINYKLSFLIFISFLLRSITGTHFVSDVMFLISIALFLRPKILEGQTKMDWSLQKS